MKKTFNANAHKSTAKMVKTGCEPGSSKRKHLAFV